MEYLRLLPPFLVLASALYSRRVILSLAIGLASASLIARGFAPLDSVHYLLFSLGDTLDLPNLSRGILSPSSNWTLFIFITTLGVIIALLQRSGAVDAFTRLIEGRVSRQKDVERVSLMLSFLFFIDDYFSSLSIGKLMVPLTDRFRIARAKLAFLIDSMCAPLAILCPFSSWVGVVIGFLVNNGVSNDPEKNPALLMAPFWVFINTIPFIFYSFLIMGTSWYIVSRGIRFGSMKTFEEHADATGDTKGNSVPAVSTANPNGRVSDFFAVWFLLVTSLLGSLLYFGGFFMLGGDNGFVEALQQTQMTLALFSCSLIALPVSLLYFVARKSISIKEIALIFREGFSMMKSALVILVIAWSMGEILREDLKVGEFISNGLLSGVSQSFFPMAVFITALISAFATGSSWGTAALLFPMVLPALLAGAHEAPFYSLEAIPHFLPTIGALLSGCVAGDHISPISDTTIMTSVSTDMPHINHVETQIIYAVPPIVSTLFGYMLLIFLPESLPLPIKALAAMAGSFSLLVVILESCHAFARACRGTLVEAAPSGSEIK